MKIIRVLFLFICFTGFTQSKVGTINVDYILSNMPELKNVQADLDKYSKELDADLKVKVDAYQKALKDYQDSLATFTDEVKKQKQKEILAQESDINKFRQNGAQLITIKQDELLRPLYQNIGASLEKVAQAGNYTQVLQSNETIAYFDPNLDLTLAVIQDLGIVLPTSEENKK